MLVQPYLNFNGRCDEALAFYQKALGAKVEMLMRFADSPDPAAAGRDPARLGAEGDAQFVSHRRFGADGHRRRLFRGDGIPGHHAVDLGQERRRKPTACGTRWSEGGTVQMPIGKTFWSPRFGMLTDRFGVAWMINTEP